MLNFSDNCHELSGICGRCRRLASLWKDRCCCSCCHEMERADRGIYHLNHDKCSPSSSSVPIWHLAHKCVRIWHWRWPLRLCQICTINLSWHSKSQNGPFLAPNRRLRDIVVLAVCSSTRIWNWPQRPKLTTCHEVFELLHYLPHTTCSLLS